MQVTEAIARRSLVLRQAGLLEVSASGVGRLASRIALVDGAVDVAHSALAGCEIVRTGPSRSVPAADHATFVASILVGRTVGVAAGCAVVSVPAVTEDMLAGRMATNESARMLAGAIDVAVGAGCQTICFGVELRHPAARAWEPLRDAVRLAAAAGAAVLIPAGNRPRDPDLSTRHFPGAFIVASLDWQGWVSPFSPLVGLGEHIILAPGEDIPGAGPNGGFTVRSGTSFAAAIAAGAFALAACVAPGASAWERAARLVTTATRALDGRRLHGPNLAHSESGGDVCTQ